MNPPISNAENISSSPLSLEDQDKWNLSSNLWYHPPPVSQQLTRPLLPRARTTRTAKYV